MNSVDVDCVVDSHELVLAGCMVGEKLHFNMPVSFIVLWKMTKSMVAYNKKVKYKGESSVH